MTREQERVYRYIVDFIRAKGYSPTIREIAVGVGQRSPGNTIRKMQVLRNDGFIVWEEGKPRTLKVLR